MKSVNALFYGIARDQFDKSIENKYNPATINREWEQCEEGLPSKNRIFNNHLHIEEL
jgi:hypothetical protein